ncbi:hypothetical protein C1930_00530 [Stenotrophomonas sp. SAU14A_NAIMI4_8]|nr:hypothetical protein C1930_00530 [Stenotrophomonas sp. SAU14A_NAIMI4_8]
MTALAESGTPVERGIAALHAYLGDDGASLLQPVSPRLGEAAVFRLPLPVDYAGVQRWLRIGFPQSFPRSTLSLRVEPSPWLIWPHAMETGLCLHGFQQKPVNGSPETVVKDSLSRLGKIIEISLPTADPAFRSEEFQREAISYWKNQQSVSNQSVSLLKRPSRSRSLIAVTVPRMRSHDGIEPVWIAESAGDISTHIRRVAGVRVNIRAPASAAFYLRLTSYPEIKAPSPEGWLAWLKPHVAVDDFAKLLFWFGESSSMSSRWVALELPGGSDSAIYCLNLRDHSLLPTRGVTLGVRAGRRQATRTSRDSLVIVSATINVLDRREILSRDRSIDAPLLSEARIVIVGQGSLGSPVALHLARAGVGHLTVIDPDELTSANLGRHVLGTDELGRNKALAMRDRLQRDVPIVSVVAIPVHVELALLTHPEVFESADIVIVTSADWASEVALWRKKSDGANWRLIQSWSEPNALVGHALVAPAGSADARPLFTDKGRFKHAFTTWPGGGSVPLPACGQSFIPGGEIGMSGVAGMVAQVGIASLAHRGEERLWVSSVSNPQLAEGLGGSYIGPVLPEHTTSMTLTRAWPEVAPNE